MSEAMTLKDLVALYKKKPDEEAGIRAVVAALRDEMQKIDLNPYEVDGVFDKILASGSVEEAAGDRIDTTLREWCVDPHVLTACGYDKLRAIESEIARLRDSERMLKKIAGLDPSQQHWAVTYARDALKW